MHVFNPNTRKGENRTMSGWDENPYPEHPVNSRNRKKKELRVKRKSKWGGGAASIGGATG